MMRRETAYKLAGRKHLHENALAEALCEHELRFAQYPEGQSARALLFLQNQPWLHVEPGVHAESLHVCYDLAHYSLRGIEQALEAEGFCLDDSLISRIKRSLTHFCEETRSRNATAPQRLIKQSNQVYVKAWEHHPHGDRDETPPELREFK
ncbi:hypothetical protein [Uliginosibacterium sp. 31-12]|uniref:hypothetical protein n=1 Tax=Uliginosibacterium sp. 31-12 TaxID=3062781 RepID=UPI0026E16D84|nr:hypothetical protein [Uliginosibacterium sp. 31-12]MDO6385517.1 hypothetical protein [Uliginosibacterium sp. 31-12]